ncbi:hypothetical protein [Roseomonas indoligenes]|uniref:Lipoprotein n=1 Tax=Roseomonas indoligenes TaxID=2820811 RepID=A0A940S3C3_9PROT|nr:hypothetical protein [Pararoseomonas indoligenes]MBP0492086.1 hypothetical protein [Pararoseomonas indoligenes]
MSRSRLPILSALLCAGALSGCAVVPEPLVAYPGPNKTAEAMQQDDAACRQQAATPAPASTTAPATTVPAATPSPAPATASPEASYFECMAARGNTVAAAPARYPAYYAPPAYAEYGPGWWGDPLWYGYYGAPFYAWGGGLGLGLGWGWGGAYRAGWRGPGYYGYGRGPGYWRGGPGRFGGFHHGGFGGSRGFGGRGGRH